MYFNLLSLSDGQLFGLLVSISGAMMLTAEALRSTARYCEYDEAMRRLTWSIGLFRTAPLMLILFSANQTMRVEQLKEIAVKHGIPQQALAVEMGPVVTNYDVTLPGGANVSWSNRSAVPMRVRAAGSGQAFRGDGGEIGRIANSGGSSGGLRISDDSASESTRF